MTLLVFSKFSNYNGVSWSNPVSISPDTTQDHTYPDIGYPVSDSGVDIVWTKGPSGMEKESEKLKVESEKLKVEIFPNPATSKANLRLQILDSIFKSFNLPIFNLNDFRFKIKDFRL